MCLLELQFHLFNVYSNAGRAYFCAMKEIEITMVVNVPDSENTDTIMDKFINWVAENGWICGGGVKDITEKRKKAENQS